LNRLVEPDFYVDIGSVLDEKAALLAEHKSQKDWLDRSQGMNAYVNTMKGFSRELGTLSKRCQFAEGWRRHIPLGLCAEDADPIRDILGEHVLGS
jgi:hypothetical protein